jgi:hypothetical protein
LLAAERAVAPTPIERRDAASIETGWVEVLALHTRGALFEGHFVERRRYVIRLWPEGARTGVEVSVRAEERAPGGTQAIRWRRIEAAAELAEEMIARIAKEAGR